MLKTYAFIDASNLFYGGEKSLGWKVDYKKLLRYLKEKYGVNKAFYYAGVELDGYSYSLLDDEDLGLNKLLKFQSEKLKRKGISEAEIIVLGRHIQRTKFYRKLKEFGYELRLRPVKVFWNDDKPVKKANCDVDMTFEMMLLKDKFGGLVAMSGDGDFVVVLKYMRDEGKRLVILARGERAAKEIKRLGGKDFRDFGYLREQLKYEDK